MCQRNSFFSHSFSEISVFRIHMETPGHCFHTDTLWRMFLKSSVFFEHKKPVMYGWRAKTKKKKCISRFKVDMTWSLSSQALSLTRQNWKLPSSDRKSSSNQKLFQQIHENVFPLYTNLGRTDYSFISIPKCGGINIMWQNQWNKQHKT